MIKIEWTPRATLAATPKQPPPARAMVASGRMMPVQSLRFGFLKESDGGQWPRIPDEMIKTLMGMANKLHPAYVFDNVLPSDRLLTDEDRDEISRIFKKAFVTTLDNETSDPYDEAMAQLYQVGREDYRIPQRLRLRVAVAKAVSAIQSDSLKAQWIDFLLKDPDATVKVVAARSFATLQSRAARDEMAQKLSNHPFFHVYRAVFEQFHRVSPATRWQIIKDTLAGFTDETHLHANLSRARDLRSQPWYLTPDEALNNKVLAYFDDMYMLARLRFLAQIHGKSRHAPEDVMPAATTMAQRYAALSHLHLRAQARDMLRAAHQQSGSKVLETTLKIIDNQVRHAPPLEWSPRDIARLERRIYGWPTIVLNGLKRLPMVQRLARMAGKELKPPSSPPSLPVG